MKKKSLLIPLMILPLVSACKTKACKIDFDLGTYENKIINLDSSELSAKLHDEFDSFFLVTHKGNACLCYSEFQNVIKSFNENRIAEGKEALPFFSFDTESGNFAGIDPILSGYVELYVIIDGRIEEKYSKGSKIDYQMFEDVSTFTKIINRHIGIEPIKNYYYVDYDFVKNTIINKDINEFVLFNIRTGCRDCLYCMPNVVTPWFRDNGSKIPVFVLDIEKYRNNGFYHYQEIKDSLLLSENTSTYGYSEGVVPTYQYWKNGTIEDAGVYANDTFDYDETSNDMLVVSTSYFDGTRDLKYTNENIIGKKIIINSNNYNNYYFDKNGKIIVDAKFESQLHDSILHSFLSYYCK